VPLSSQYEITDDAMTAQFEIGANDVEGYDAIVGQAAWLGLRLRHWPLFSCTPSDSRSINPRRTPTLNVGPCCVEENEMSYHIEIDEYQRRLIMKAVPSRVVLEFGDAISGISRVSGQAARSIG
jgi:hypothetical protein